MAEQLTPQQEMAASNRGGKLLVSAAAGSGKTMVLVERVLRRLMDPQDPAELDEFLMITYTKAAAQELRGKIAAKLTAKIAENPENRHLQRQLQRLYLTEISTVHGFCSDLLRDYAFQLDLSADFRVADENECRELREQALSDLLNELYSAPTPDPDFCAFADTQGFGRNDNRIGELVNKVYDSARCHLNPDEWLEQCLYGVEISPDKDASQTPWGEYQLQRLHGILDVWIPVAEQCAKEAAQGEKLEKVSDLFAGYCAQMRYLKDSQLWDEAYHRRMDWGRFPTIKNPQDPILLDRLKAAKEALKEAVTEAMKPFSVPSATVIAKVNQCAPSCRGLIGLVRKFSKAYEQAKRGKRVLDFGDLEHKTLDLLTGRNRKQVTAAANEIAKRFREVMVDEYQDSNQVQDAIFAAITDQKKNLFLVGDVKQSIYSFRLADPGIFLQKYESFLPAEEAKPGQGRKVLLCDNFRSGGEVIEAVNAVFSASMSREVGGLEYTEAEALREGGAGHIPLQDPCVEFWALETDGDKETQEAAFTAQRIRQMLAEKTLIRTKDGTKPVEPEDIVVLLRSVKNRAVIYQQALEQAGVPCTTDAGGDLLKTDEIAAIRALLQTVANPQQDIPLLSILASPVFGITADELAAVRVGHTKCSFFDALRESELPKVRKFLDILSELRREAAMNPLTDLLERCFTLTRLDSIYAAMPGGQARQENLRGFYAMAAEYAAGNSKTLRQFLEYMDSLEDCGLPGASASRTGVTIMSIHKSKGLEFPVVFLCDLSRKFNNASAREQILCDQDLGVGLYCVDVKQRVRTSSALREAISAKISAGSASEEMRVLYVAMTRAKDRLVMTYAKDSKAMEKTIADYASLLPIVGQKRLCAQANTPGDWVLLSALSRTEAGELLAGTGEVLPGRVSRIPWKICRRVAEIPETSERPLSREEAVSEDDFSELSAALGFSYAHIAATQAPSKQTATGRKGRRKDEESAELAPEPAKPHRSWRKAHFVDSKPGGREYGIAMHAAMQYLNFAACGSKVEIEAQLDYLAQTQRLSQEQRTLIDPEQLYAFFQTPFGRKLTMGAPCIREFKFSLLEEETGELEGEQVLLQGVVDCALTEEDGITILDFKTDRVDETTLAGAVRNYTPQVQTYAQALEKIFEQPVKAAYLYFFRLGKLEQVHF